MSEQTAAPIGKMIRRVTDSEMLVKPELFTRFSLSSLPEFMTMSFNQGILDIIGLDSTNLIRHASAYNFVQSLPSSVYDFLSVQRHSKVDQTKSYEDTGANYLEYEFQSQFFDIRNENRFSRSLNLICKNKKLRDIVIKAELSSKNMDFARRLVQGTVHYKDNGISFVSSDERYFHGELGLTSTGQKVNQAVSITYDYRNGIENIVSGRFTHKGEDKTIAVALGDKNEAVLSDIQRLFLPPDEMLAALSKTD